MRKYAPNTQPLPRAIAAHASKRTRRGTCAMVPVSMAMTMIVSMGPRFPVLFPTIPIIFELRSRVSLALRTILARSQRRQLKTRPDVPARSRTAGAACARGARRSSSNRWGRRSCRWSYRSVFPRRRRHTAMSRTSLPSAILARLALLLLLLLPRVDSRCWRRRRRIARLAPPVRWRWRVLIRVVARWRGVMCRWRRRMLLMIRIRVRRRRRRRAISTWGRWAGLIVRARGTCSWKRGRRRGSCARTPSSTAA